MNLITHFYNEEYLLPFWIDWHKRLPLSSVTLIDYDSTDNSAAIIKEMSPEWNLITSRNEWFDAIKCDKEVMDIEKGLEGWKIALTTTEFLILPENPVEHLESLGECVACPRTVVIGDNQDPQTHDEFFAGFDKIADMTELRLKHPNPVGQHYSQVPMFCRATPRFLHKKEHGNYIAGRHRTFWSTVTSDKIFVAWCGYYPWNEKTLARKLQIKDKIPESDKRLNHGVQHMRDKESMEQGRTIHARKLAYPESYIDTFNVAYNSYKMKVKDEE